MVRPLLLGCGKAVHHGREQKMKEAPHLMAARKQGEKETGVPPSSLKAYSQSPKTSH
jgi:hypothetical protein